MTQVIAGLLMAIGALWMIRLPRSPFPTRSEIQTTEQNDNFPPARRILPGYLGPKSCAECHRDRVEEFMHTNHFRACRKPDPATMPDSFQSQRGHFTSPIPQLQFEMSQRGENFFQTAVLSTPQGTERTTSRVDLVYGLAPTDEVYFTWRGDRLYELPVAWLHPQNEWGISPIDPHGKGDFSRPLTPRCLECHNTWFEHVPGTLNQYNPNSFVLGVTCERCHGPGQDHVAYHKVHPDERIGRAIVQPGHLSRDRLIDVCAQCHSNAIKHRGPAFNYRPGQPLEDCYKTVGSRYPEDDHVANQTKYMQESKCFQKSDSLTCVTCHNPHKPHDRESPKPEETSAHSCLKCHTGSSCGDRPNLPTKVRDNCIGCHMPARNKVQVFFDTRNKSYVSPVKAYEHRIGIHRIARQEVLRDWYCRQSDDESRRLGSEMSANLAAHWLAEGERLRADYRHLAAIDALRHSLELDPNPETEQKLQHTISDRLAIDRNWFAAAQQIAEKKFSESAETLEQILKLKPDHAKVHGKLGTVYASLGQRERAIEHLQSVAKIDPDDAYGEGMLGWIDFLDGRHAEAIEHFRRADVIEPYKAKIHFQWGLAAVKSNAWDQAADHFRLAMTIDPNHADACDSLSRVMQSQGQLKEALQLAIRATRITNRQQPAMLLHLAEVFAETRQFHDARQTAADALDIAQKTQSQLLPVIQQRLNEYGILEHKNKK